MNPWGLMGAQPQSQASRPPLLHMGVPPLGFSRPSSSTFMPHTGTGWAGQAHPYSDTVEKKQQEQRELKTPWRAFPLEGLNT